MNILRILLGIALAFLPLACAATPIKEDIAARLAEADEPAPDCPAPVPIARAPSSSAPAAASRHDRAYLEALRAAPSVAAKSAPAPSSRTLRESTLGTGAAAPANPIASDGVPRARGPVTAGVADDNERWGDYLAYRRRAGGFNVRERAVEERIVIEVRDDDGRPVHDAAVEGGGARLRTDSSGRALFHPYASGRSQETRWTITARKRGLSSSAVAELGQPNNLRLVLAAPRSAAAPRLDLLFLIDTTGSMADEIERLRGTMDVIVKDIVKSTAADKGALPDIRYGLVHYRDRGDEYVVRTHEFTASLRAFRKDLACLRAAGGGDFPESLNAALNAAVHQMAWRGEDAVRMVILIADAPPQFYRDEQFDYAQDMTHAAAKGVKIFPIGASGLDGQGEYIFRQMAQYTGGKFVFLTYAERNRPGVAPGVETSHDVKDYSVDNLDRIVVKFVTEELRPLR